MAGEMGVPFLGAIPIDPGVVMAGDSGRAPIQMESAGPAVQSMRAIIKSLAAAGTKTKAA